MNEKNDRQTKEESAKAAGDAIAEVYERAVRGAARHLKVHFDDAREAVHKVALGILEAEAKKKRKIRLRNPRAYLTKSAIGAHQRSQGEKRLVLFSELSPEEKIKLFEETPGGGPDPAKVAEENELASLAWGEMAKLPPRRRQVVAMRSSGLDFVEIGRVLGISAASARVHYHLGVQHLRRRFRHAA